MNETSLSRNLIFLRRKRKLILEKQDGELSIAHIATFLKELAQLGYSLSPELIELVQTFSIDQLNELHLSLIHDLKEMLGAHVEYKPMYPNFPKQVMEMDEADLYFNAILHYLGDHYGFRIMPQFKKEERPPLADTFDLKTIELGTEEEFCEMIKGLIGANTSISETDKEDIQSAISIYADDIQSLIPESIPHKENLTYFTGVLLEYTDTGEEVIANLFKTATDVLRLAVTMSDGDVSLATNTKFRNFKRSERRLILSALENSGNITEDMLRYKNQWIRLGEILHPGEHKKRYPKAFTAFDILRNNKPFETFNSQVEKLMLNWDMVKGADLLAKRPGEFARRLDQMIRYSDDSQPIIEKFTGIADKVSTPVLLQVMKHFKHRNEESDMRVIFPKGRVGKAVGIPNRLGKIEEDACKGIIDVVKSTLTKRFSDKASLGKVYLDKSLEKYIVPFSQRSASKALRTLVRGSRVPMPTGGDTIRFFLWWKEGELNGKNTGRVDVDLSSVLYDADWNYKEHISYTNLKSANYRAAHSGDITSAPNGACEFIDIDIPSVLEYGGRYVVMSIISFTDQPFSSMPECFGGWMIRQDVGSGEIFEPKTVVDKLDVTANTRFCIPVILDLQERELIWTDIALTSRRIAWQASSIPTNQNVNSLGINTEGNNIETNQKGMVVMGKAMTNLKKLNLYELFELHANARGEVVEDIEEADTIFSPKEGITPFDIEVIMSEYLA